MRFDLAIFDCDGVLFDSKNANRQYYNLIKKTFGQGPLDEEEMDFVHMHTAVESVRYLFRHDPSLAEAALRHAATMDYSDFMEHMVMEPGVVETLEAIRPPLLTAVSTNRSTTMPRLIEVFGLDKWFDLIVCALDVEKPKPHPEGAFKILETLGVDRTRAVYIGDSVADEEVAERAGLPLVAYKNPGLKAMFHVKHFNEIRDLLLSA